MIGRASVKFFLPQSIYRINMVCVEFPYLLADLSYNKKREIEGAFVTMATHTCAILILCLNVSHSMYWSVDDKSQIDEKCLSRVKSVDRKSLQHLQHSIPQKKQALIPE